MTDELNLEQMDEVSGGKGQYGGYASKPGPKAGCTVYQIKPGERLGDIAKRHGTTCEKIKAVNPTITDVNKIRANYWIYIPQ